MKHVLKRPDTAKVTASVGDEIAVELPEQGSAGYEWQFETSGPLKPIASEIVPSDVALGGPYTRRTTFAVTKPGDAKLVGRLKRPWERSHVDEVTYEIVAND